MLDRRTTLVLNKINQLCSGGSFEVVEQEELLSCFPETCKTDAEGLRHILSYLEENGYIDMQYAEEGLFCVCPLPAGRTYFENVRQARSDSFRRRRELFLLSATGAFIGALVGVVVAWLFITYVM